MPADEAYRIEFFKSFKISSSWIGGCNDMFEVGAYRVSNGKKGKKLKPRKKRGPKLSEAGRLELAQKAEAARERRRGGFHV